VAAALVVLVGAGWTGNPDFRGSNLTPDTLKHEPMVAYSRVSGTSYDAVSMDYGAAEESFEVNYSNTTAGGGLTGSYSAKQSSAQPAERKLVRTVSLTMRTGSYEQDVAAIQELVASVGGYEEYHYESGDVASGDSRYVEMTLRIPADQLDTFLGSVGGIGRVVNRSENVVDRTTEYTDNETRLNTLNTKMARLQELLAKGVMYYALELCFERRHKHLCNLLCAAIFALFHVVYVAPMMLLSMALSLATGWIFQKYRYVWGCATAHFAIGFFYDCFVP
jgi:hypothetical protein